MIENEINTLYRVLASSVNTEYVWLYDSLHDDKLKIIFSTLHAKLMFLLDKLNMRLPTQESRSYYWADESRRLIRIIDIIIQFKKVLTDTPFEFQINKYYENLFAVCKNFLCQNEGSFIPPQMNKIEVPHTIPIFTLDNKSI